MIEKCGFDSLEDCTEKCRYFIACTRNPYKFQRREKDNGGRKVDKDNN